MRTVMVVLVGLCLGIQGLEAQGTAKPFTNRKLESAEDYSRIIGSNDSTVLYIHADEIAAAAQQAIGHKLSGYADMADWLRELEKKPCPAGEAQLARILTEPNKRVDVNGWRRPFRVGEDCLYADNEPVIALDCGNFITKVFPSRAEEPRSALLSVPLTLVDDAQADWGDILLRLASARDTVVVEKIVKVPVQQSSGPGWLSRNWKWATPSALGVAGSLIWWAVESSGDIRMETRIH